MKKSYIPLLAFFILLLLNLPFGDFATSVVPGWHTTIFPPYFVAGIVLIIILLLLVIGYWLLLRRTDKINWILFVIHLVFTIPAIIFLKFPAFFLDREQANQEALFKEVYIRMMPILISWALFWFGQILFIIYFMRTMMSKRVANQ